MTIARQSQTGLILPGVFRSQPVLASLAQAGEQPLLDATAELEVFLNRLRPETAPASWLPWLLWAQGGEDYYRPDWTETRTRLVLSRLVDLYRSRGTIDGLGLHLSLLADQKILNTIQPPAKMFAGVSLAPPEREAFEARFPEIRVWPFQHAGVARTAMVDYAWPGGSTAETKGRAFPAVTDAADRIGDRLEWHDPLPSTERPAGAFGADGAGVGRGSDGAFEIRVRGLAIGLFPGRWLVGYPVDHGAARRLYRVVPDLVGGRGQLAILPTLTPIRVRADELRLHGSGAGFFLQNRYANTYPDCGGSFIGQSLITRHAERRIGYRSKLFDPARAMGLRHGGRTFIGAAALGAMPAHQIETAVDMRGWTASSVIWVGRHLRGHLDTSDVPARIARGRWAGDLARRAACRLLLNISPWNVVRARNSIVAGRVVAGEIQVGLGLDL